MKDFSIELQNPLNDLDRHTGSGTDRLGLHIGILSTW